MLIALRLKDPPCLGKLCDQPSGDTLGNQPLGYLSSKISPEGADPLWAMPRSERSLSIVWHS